MENEIVTMTIPKEEKEIIAKVLDGYAKGRNILDTTYPLLRGYTPLEWIDRNRAQYLGEERPELRILAPDVYVQVLNFTKTNVRKLLASFAQQGVKVQISAVNKSRNFGSDKDAKIGDALLKYGLDKSRDEDSFLASALEAVTVGTCFEYNGFSIDVTSKSERVTKKYNLDTGQYEAVSGGGELKYMGLVSKIVPVNDFLFSDPYTPIQDQPFVIWRERVNIEAFRKLYSGYPQERINRVKPGIFTIYNNENEEAYFDKSLVTDLEQNQVEIIRYYEKFTNSYIVVANGELIENGVMPFIHGQYPFTRKVFSDFSGQFFMYGDSFPNLIAGEQELMNYMWTLMTHQQKWASTPFITAREGSFGLDQEPIEAMSVIKVNEQDDIMVQKTPDVSSGGMAMIGKLQEFIREFSGNLSGGSDLFTPQGGKVQSSQLMMANQNALINSGFSMVYIEKGERDKKEQQFWNCKQFYTLPQINMVSGGSLTQNYNFKYSTLYVNNATIDDNQKGLMILKMFDPTEQNLDMEALREELSILEEIERAQGRKAKAIAYGIESFNKVEWSIKIEKFSSYTKNQQLELEKRTMAYNFLRENAMMGILTDVNLPEVAKWVVELFDGLDESKIFNSVGAIPGQMQQQQLPGGQTPQPGQQPGGMTPQEQPPVQ